VSNTGERCVRGSSDREETGWESTQLVAVRHPYIELVVYSGEEDINVAGCRSVAGDG
jgi:hypothetical protein